MQKWDDIPVLILQEIFKQLSDFDIQAWYVRSWLHIFIIVIVVKLLISLFLLLLYYLLLFAIIIYYY